MSLLRNIIELNIGRSTLLPDSELVEKEFLNEKPEVIAPVEISKCKTLFLSSHIKSLLVDETSKILEMGPLLYDGPQLQDR